MRSRISIEEEEQNEINKNNKFSEELNKTADRMKKFAAQYAIIIENKNIESIDLQTQDKIIQVALIMETFMEGQKQLISNLLNEYKKEEEED